MRTALALLLTAGTAAADPAFDLVVGGGAFWGHDDIAITRTTALGLQGSFRLYNKLDLVVGFDGFTGNFSPEPTNEQSVINVLGGLRWFPYRRTPRDDVEPTALYVHVMTGVSLLTLIPYDSFFETNDPDAAGLVGGGAIGWMPAHIGNVLLGMEMRGHLILYNNDFGFRKAITANIVLEVDID